MNSSKTSFKNLNLLNERRWISYCLRFPEHSFDLPPDYILNSLLQQILKAIQDIHSKHLIVTSEEVVNFLEKEGIRREIFEIKELMSIFSSNDNIDWVKTTIKDSFISNHLNVKIIEELLVETNKAGGLDRNKLQKLAEGLLENIAEADHKDGVYTSQESADIYKNIIDEREKGIKKRIFGFTEINKRMPRGAAQGELSILVAQKGAGKSALAQNIINQLIIQRVPVINFSLEMSHEVIMDRFMCMRMSCTIDELNDSKSISELDKRERFKVRLNRYITNFGKENNYVHVDEPGLSIFDIDRILSKVVKRFRDEKVFVNNDEYMFVVIDLATMLTDVSGEDSYAVDDAVNQLHKLVRKYKSHFLLVVQANENKLRGRLRFSTPEEIDRYVITFEDIKGASGWAERGRLVFSLTRPNQMKKQYFPDRIDEWELEEDILWFQCIKNNNGKLFRIPFAFIADNLLVIPRKHREIENSVPPTTNN